MGKFGNFTWGVKKEISTLVTNTPEFLGRIGVGCLKGIYTPFLLNTGIQQYLEVPLDFSDRKNLFFDIVEIGTQASTAAIIILGGVVYTIRGGVRLENVGLLAATNALDYLVHSYRRGKMPAELTDNQ